MSRQKWAVEHIDRPWQIESRAVLRRRLTGDAWRRVMQFGQVVRDSRRDLKWRSVWPQEGQRTVEPTDHGESAFMDGAMMASAQKHEVVEVRRTAVGPMMHVVRVASAGRAALKPTSGVARGESAADRRRNGARLAAHVEHSAVAVVTHVHQRGVTGQTPRRSIETYNAPWSTSTAPSNAAELAPGDGGLLRVSAESSAFTWRTTW